MVDWTEKYRPRTLSKVAGNAQAIKVMKAWAERWSVGIPKKRALIISGPPGVGKTSAALALAHDMRWGVVELNASDARNATSIRRIATMGALHDTFSDSGDYLSIRHGHRKLIILDEADNMYETISERSRAVAGDFSDRGGKRAVVQTIRQTVQPIILIVNDIYELVKGSGAPLRDLCEIVKFSGVRSNTVKRVLKEILKNEEYSATEDALDLIAQRSSGDLRSAIRDMEMLCTSLPKGSLITADDVMQLGERDRHIDIFKGVSKILKTTVFKRAREAYDLMDEQPDRVLLWLDENVPLEYRDPEDLDRAIRAITRADIYLAEARRTQNYSLWPYAIDMMTGGVALAKRETYRGYVKYRFPAYLSRMRASKTSRRLDESLCRKIGRYVHMSAERVRYDVAALFAEIFKNDRSFAVHMTRMMDLEEEEVSALLGVKDVSEIMAEAERLRRIAPGDREQITLESFGV